ERGGQEARKQGKERGDGVDSPTGGPHVGPTLTQPPHQRKLGSKPLKDIK
ncbi:Os02g0215600, partial [Oryza sativa Japonica Group]